MKILRAVEKGLEIPENLDDLVLSEDEKENKQDIEMIAKITRLQKTDRFRQTGDTRTGTDRGYAAPEKTEESAQTTDADHAETEEK